ncbi:MAG: nickel-dependent lactate racemase [Chloroflexi bacterium]|nr:nickel-dependent lactate racemase [Chloroflexota bacterium]
MTTTRVKLAYGRSGLDVELPENRSTVIEPRFLEGLPDEAAALRRALRDPIESAPLRERVSAGASVAIVVCDITRPMPSARVLPVLLAELDHVDPTRVTIFIATGTHRANSPEELDRMLGREVARSYRIVNHDAFDLATHKHLGQTSSGGPIWIDRDFLEHDVKILTGFIEPHFFAGFSGGPKMVAPGLAALETVLHLHGAPMIAHPDARWGVTVGNPIHDDVREISRIVQPDFTLDVTINKDHQITGVFAGELFAAHRQGCEFVRQTAMQPVATPFEVVVTTNSGYPLDLNLYQAVKGMSAAAQIVRQGGAIIAAAECSEGLPDFGNYKDILRMGDSPDDLLELINRPTFRMHDQWEVQVQAQIQRKARVHLKADGLSDEQIRGAHLDPCRDVAETAARLLADYGPDARLAVLPQGPQTIPYVA